MVQRMLTAPDVRRSRRSLILSGLADIPIVLTFLTIGLLLWTYYQAHPDPTLPKTPNETFCHFILYEMPIGLRGLLIAGIFATAMGSLSTAINALATSFTRDWYEPYINPQSNAEQSLARGALGHGLVFRSHDCGRLDDVVHRHHSSRNPHHSDRARDFRLHLWLASRCVSLRHVHAPPREQPRQHYRHDRRLHRGRDLERAAEQHRANRIRNKRSASISTLSATDLAAGDGISMVDLLRNHRHVCRGDAFPDKSRTSSARTRVKSLGR